MRLHAYLNLYTRLSLAFTWGGMWQGGVLLSGRDSGFAVQQQRMTMRLYRMLRLTPEQEQDLAARWRSWCRRREFLSKQLEAALKLLKDNAPQLEDLPPALLRSVTQAGKPGCAIIPISIL